MSRSRRKQPFGWHGTADSDKIHKQRANRRLRRKVRAALPRDEDGVLPVLREVSTVWGFAKDEKIRFDPAEWPKWMRK